MADDNEVDNKTYILLKVVRENDMPQWLELSHKYDVYIEELVRDLFYWYEGNENVIAFSDYMKSKIAKEEAILGVERENCFGIIAFSKSNNSITYFGYLNRLVHDKKAV